MKAVKVKKVRTSAYIPESQSQELSRIAESQDRSKSWVLAKAIEKGLELLSVGEKG